MEEMKKGLTLTELATKLQQQRETQKDYIVPVEKMTAKVNEENKLVLNFTNGSEQNYSLNTWSGSQVAQFADIPKQYFDRLSSENPDLAAQNINHGFSKLQNEKRMIRCQDNYIRGFLSNGYRRLDAYDMLENTLPTIFDAGLEVVSSEVNERKLFIKMLSPKLQGEITKGDLVQYGLTISTSDVGAGSVRIEPLIYRLVCANGLISDTALRKFHRTSKHEVDTVFELLSDKTKEMTDAAFWAQCNDLIKLSLETINFEKEIEKLKKAAQLPITNFDLPNVVELSMRAVNVSGEQTKNSILAALASGNEGAGLTQWGLVNSFTKAAQADHLDYEQSIDLERAASKIITLSPKQWETIAS
jgi:hypothetical protein